MVRRRGWWSWFFGGGVKWCLSLEWCVYIKEKGAVSCYFELELDGRQNIKTLVSGEAETGEPRCYETSTCKPNTKRVTDLC